MIDGPSTDTLLEVTYKTMQRELDATQQYSVTSDRVQNLAFYSQIVTPPQPPSSVP